MWLNHFHVNVRDLKGAILWFEKVWGIKPVYESDGMASFNQAGFTFILDVADNDALSTIGFNSDNCDLDFQNVISKGATVIEKPSDKPWGVRAAYIKGPGKITLEIEQLLLNSST